MSRSAKIRTLLGAWLATVLMITFVCPVPASAQQVGLIGEIRLFAGTFAPQGWYFCDGRILQIVEYDTLFSLLGCNFGGDCRTTFALPDLRGRTAMGDGTGHGLTGRYLAEQRGKEQAQIDSKHQGRQLTVAPAATGHSGASLETMPPALGLNYIICWSGYYPERN